jgi:hypothetical protein
MLVAVILAVTFAFAAESQEFRTAAIKAAEKLKTSAGAKYGGDFLLGTNLEKPLRACDSSDFPVGSSYDVVFVISASGQIENTVQGPSNGYGDCIASHLRELRPAPKPPSASWPVNIRFLHGHPDEQLRTQRAFLFVADNAVGGR